MANNKNTAKSAPAAEKTTATKTTTNTEVKETGLAPQSDYQKAYELEDKRLADVAATQSEKDPITDVKATKTDGTANVNADKSLPTTEAQKGLDENVRTGEVEQPNLNKTAEEQLGLANPDERLAEELREAKVSGNVPQDAPKK